MKFSIPTYRIKSLLSRIDKYNRKANKYKVAPITYTISKTYEKQFPTGRLDMFGEYIYETVMMNDIDLSTDLLKPIKGYTFLASIEHMKEGNVLISRMNDVKIPDKYRTSGSYCEHCKTDRYRKFTYIVYNEKKKSYVQVGSTCIKDYLGIDVASVASRFQILHMFQTYSEDRQFGVNAVPTYHLKGFLCIVSNMIDKMGFVSGKVAYEQGGISTGHQAWKLLIDPKYASNFKFDFFETSDETKGFIDKVIEWALAQKPTTDYMSNLQILIKSDAVTYKTANTAASVIFAYKKANEQLTVKKYDFRKSVYLGKVGEQIREKVEFLGDYATESHYSRYGLMFIYRFVTTKGNLITWFTSKEESFERDKVYNLVAKVKKYNEWKDMKATIVKNAKIS